MTIAVMPPRMWSGPGIGQEQGQIHIYFDTGTVPADGAFHSIDITAYLSPSNKKIWLFQSDIGIYGAYYASWSNYGARFPLDLWYDYVALGVTDPETHFYIQNRAYPGQPRSVKLPIPVEVDIAAGEKVWIYAQTPAGDPNDQTNYPHIPTSGPGARVSAIDICFARDL